MLQLGAHLPQNEFGADTDALRRFAAGCEDIGYDYLIMGEHVLSHDASTQRAAFPEGGAGRGEERPYTPDWVWREPLVLFGYLAAITTRIRFMPSVLVLPLRQTALLAKQAAEVDALSGGRLILGVGVGWSALEFEAMGEEFPTRGRRAEEQIALLRALWSEPLVHFEGRFHRVRGGGLNPRPARPIPIWAGGMSDPVLDRIGRLCDGWSIQRTYYTDLSPEDADADFAARLGRVHAAARAAGRDPAAIGLGAAIDAAGNPLERQLALARQWEARGATHLALRTTRAGLGGEPDRHLETLRAFHDACRRG